MIAKRLLLALLVLMSVSLDLQAQETGNNSLNPEQEQAIQNRWLESQPIILLRTDSGRQYTGQPIHAALDSVYLLPGSALPVGPEWYKDLQRISLNEIEEVLLQRGGSRLTRSNIAEDLGIPQSDRFYSKPFQALRRASVYEDSLIMPGNLEEAFKHSKVLRQVFPAKRIRISVGLGIGGQGAGGDAQEALRQSQLPYPDNSYGNRAFIDPVDVSVRFLDRWIVGGQYRVNNSSEIIYAYGNEQNVDRNYDYYFEFTEHRIYSEYAWIHVDRYFTKKYELLVGAGYLLGRPEWSMNYNFNDTSDPDNWLYENVWHVQEGKLHGVQLRSAFHYYLFPGFSLWSGLEVNYFKPWTIETVEFPTPNPGVDISLEEHRLNFSSVRIKFGVSIYL